MRAPLATSRELIEAYRERHALAAAWPAALALVLAPVMTIGAPPVGFDLRGPAALRDLFRAARWTPPERHRQKIIGPRFAENWCLDAAELVQTRVDP